MLVSSFARVLIIALVLTAGTPTYVLAQDSAGGYDAQRNQLEAERPKNEFSITGGGSFSSPTLIGTTRSARLGVFALRYGRNIFSNKSVALQYGVEVVPAAVLSLPDRTFTGRRESVYGFGASPIGFKLSFKPKKRLQPFVGTSGGFLYFSRDVPVINASRFNFTFDFGGGVQIFSRANRAVTVGYKFQHISNGGTAAINPGVDANVFYAGFSIFR